MFKIIRSLLLFNLLILPLAGFTISVSRQDGKRFIDDARSACVYDPAGN
jgi:hypothetical protein